MAKLCVLKYCVCFLLSQQWYSSPSYQTKYSMNDSTPVFQKYQVLQHLECTAWKRWFLDSSCLFQQCGLFTALFGLWWRQRSMIFLLWFMRSGQKTQEQKWLLQRCVSAMSSNMGGETLIIISRVHSSMILKHSKQEILVRLETLARMGWEIISIGKRSFQLYSVMDWKENTCVSYSRILI